MAALPSSSALVVIDVQCGWYLASPGPHDAAATLARINDLIDRARTAGRPIIFIQHAEAPDYSPGTPEWELHPGLHRLPADPVVGKTVCDAFHATTLQDKLSAHGVDTIVICGAATEFCVDTTIRAAASLGYHVVVPSDAHATKDRPVLKATDIIAHHNWVWSEFSSPQPIVVAPSGALAFN